MAGTVTATEITHTSAKKLIWDWLSSAGGAADHTTTFAFDGRLVGLITIPDGGGTAPTADYDVAITDADGHDVLLGAGANRSATATEFVAEASLAAVCGSKLTLAVTNAGNAKGGTVVLFVR